MTHLDSELKQLKEEILEMWRLVILQMRKTNDALIHPDKDLALEVIANEKRINAFELKIDRDCENIFALCNPVAIDLRFVLAVLKINNNLERTGDIADGIAKFLVKEASPFDKLLLENSKVLSMFAEANAMITDTLSAFENEDTRLARSIFKRDEYLNDINLKANKIICDYIRENQENIEQALNVLSIIRKLERVGDQCKNIAEEIIFYIEAKILKHSDLKTKSGKK